MSKVQEEMVEGRRKKKRRVDEVVKVGVDQDEEKEQNVAFLEALL